MDIHDPTLWVAVGFVILIAGVYKPAKRALLGMLDARVEAVRRELDEAVALREEAQQLLAEYQRKQRVAVQEAEDVMAAARDEAERLLREGKDRLEDMMKRREQAAADKIAQSEADALREIRTHAIDIAVSATRQVIVTRLDEEQSSILIDQAVAELPGKLH